MADCVRPALFALEGDRIGCRMAILADPKDPKRASGQALGGVIGELMKAGGISHPPGTSERPELSLFQCQ